MKLTKSVLLGHYHAHALIVNQIILDMLRKKENFHHTEGSERVLVK